MDKTTEIYNNINYAIDCAFTEENYEFDFYTFLTNHNYKRNQIKEFLSSSLYLALVHQVEELDFYLADSNNLSIFKESYDWMGKTKASKIKIFLTQIIEDAEKYEQSKRPGRKKKVATANK